MQGAPDCAGKGVRLEVRVGANTQWVLAEAEDLVRQVSPCQRRDAAVEKLDHDRQPASLVDAELDPLGCGVLVLGQPRAQCGETRDVKVLSLVGLKFFKLFIFRGFESGIWWV